MFNVYIQYFCNNSNIFSTNVHNLLKQKFKKYYVCEKYYTNRLLNNSQYILNNSKYRLKILECFFFQTDEYLETEKYLKIVKNNIFGLYHIDKDHQTVEICNEAIKYSCFAHLFIKIKMPKKIHNVTHYKNNKYTKIESISDKNL